MGNKHIHLIGIGGISMSGIARLLLDRGFKVSGSDRKDSQILSKLRQSGAAVYIGHAAENVVGADEVIVSNAIPENNCELQYARKHNLSVLVRAEAIARLMEGKTGIAVSGTHGKTTTTSMLSLILKRAHLDPTVLVGGELDELGGNVYQGHGDYFVTEADESDGSLLYLNPRIGVITNMELDHHNYYDSQHKLNTTFLEFIRNINEGGTAVICVENDNLQKFTEDVNRDDIGFLTYGLTAGALRAGNIQLLPFGSYFNVIYNDNELGEINLQVPGYHNILNSLAAIGVGMSTGLSFTTIKKALSEFNGVKRRFEKKGLIKDILVVDDYAHHPTEIKATLAAASNTGYERIIAIFQPHRYSRTAHLMEEFSRSFAEVDHLIITDIYSADEEKIPGIKAENLVHLIKKNTDRDAKYIAEKKDIVTYLKKIIRSRDLVLTIGAGDVYRVGEMLLTMNEKKEMA